MPTAPLRPCAEPRCAALVRTGRCPQHAVQQEHQRDNYAIRRWYRTVRWKRLRTQVLSQQPLCVECRMLGRTTIATEVDHVLKHGGHEEMFWDIRNLQGLCVSHHAAKTARGE